MMLAIIIDQALTYGIQHTSGMWISNLNSASFVIVCLYNPALCYSLHDSQLTGSVQSEQYNFPLL